MRVKLPSTPTMRYERMAIALIAAGFAGVMGFAFMTQAVGAAAAVSWADFVTLSPAAVQAATLLLLASCGITVTLALLLLAAIKMTSLQPATHKSASVHSRLRRLAIQLLHGAAGVVLAFIVFQAAAVFLV